MSPSTVQETVTVTAESPLLDVATSSLGGNIDPAAGAGDAVGRTQLDGAAAAGAGESVNVGQSVRAARNAEREPDARVSDERRRHAVRQHDGRRRTAGVQPGDDRRVPVHLEPVRRDPGPVVGRAGEHDHQVGHQPVRRLVPRQLPRRPLQRRESRCSTRVVPIKNQQFAGSFGGPIMRDKLHFFFFDEYERAPKTEVWNTPFPTFNVSLDGTSTVKHIGARLDYQFSPQTRLMVKGNKTTTDDPFGPGNTQHPAATANTYTTSDGLVVQLTKVLSNRALNEVSGGYASYLFGEGNLTTWSKHLDGGTAGHSGPSPPDRRASPSPTSRCGQQRRAALPRAEPVQHQGQLHTLLRRDGPSRPEDRRRVPARADLHVQLHAVHGRDRRARRSSTSQSRSRSCRIRSTSIPGTSRPFRRSRAATRWACTRAVANRNGCGRTARSCRTTGT